MAGSIAEENIIKNNSGDVDSDGPKKSISNQNYDCYMAIFDKDRINS
jgi:hypothetical protein